MAFEEYLVGHRRQATREEQQLYKMSKIAKVKAGEIAMQLFKEFKVKKVYLFGSLASGDFIDGSDIDLAVTGLAEERYLSAYGVAERLAAPFKIDLVLLETARESLQARILREGVILFDFHREKESPTKTSGL